MTNQANTNNQNTFHQASKTQTSKESKGYVTGAEFDPKNLGPTPVKIPNTLMFQYHGQ